MFSALFGFIANWRLWLAAALIAAFIFLAFGYKDRGHELEIRANQIKGLETEITSLAEENGRLAASALAARTAAQAQSLICRAEIERREYIEEITEVKPVAIPAGAVDVGVSKKTVGLINHDLFAPLPSGLRGQAD